MVGTMENTSCIVFRTNQPDKQGATGHTNSRICGE